MGGLKPRIMQLFGNCMVPRRNQFHPWHEGALIQPVLWCLWNVFPHIQGNQVSQYTSSCAFSFGVYPIDQCHKLARWAQAAWVVVPEAVCDIAFDPHACGRGTALGKPAYTQCSTAQFGSP